METAVIGAGFCGLAVAWHLAQDNRRDIVIFDTNPIGKSSSAIAAGLLHPYVGARCKLNRDGREALAATLQLIAQVEKETGMVLRSQTGLIRPATTKEQKDDFTCCATLYDDVRMMSPEEYQSMVPGAPPLSALYIESAWLIDCPRYIQGLWQLCERRGVRFEQRTIATLAELDHYHTVVVAGGALSKQLPELAHEPITPIKGQLLELEFPDNFPNLSTPLSSQVYLFGYESGKKGVLGATFEREFSSLQLEIGKAVGELIPKVQAYLPTISAEMVMGCRAGVRASTPGHLPLVKGLGQNRWLITGMGSKGLLYHAFYAKVVFNNGINNGNR